MTLYLLKSGILLLVFYAVYKLWLENEKMFRFNRIYLLGSLVFSFVIPLQLISIASGFSNKIGFIQLEELVIQKSNENAEMISVNDFVFVLIGIFYAFIVLMLTIRLVLNLYSFYKRIKNNQVEFIQGEKIVLIEQPILPHSFWKSIFINKNEFEKGKIPSELIAHEKAHLDQKHTLDILFIEVLQIVFWFNPLLVFYKKAIKLNHEFLADEAVNKQFGSVKSYQNLLLDFASHKNTVALASNINYLITKKRLLMMTKKESPIKIVLKVFSVGVVYALLLFVFSTKATAQKALNKADVKEKDLYVLADVEKLPEFPGGLTKFYKFIGENFKMSAEANKNKIEGKAYMQFIIEKDGSLSGIKTLQDPGYGIGDEATRVLKLSPKWTAATQEGKPVRVMYSLPITLQAEK
ncbi:peptidase M56, BlaR1 [Flavobacterium aquidurense]|jgi:beta-lactamase regulating signal transducer with metallopeptidase domain|uniref:M56 family metallopeptidase n=1 Tax=Flavobacterium aquidurense TaxID=362413 RepID=UPI000912E681|nr:M56 family metallopeptidase [Flavobacterium aquidurense]OXA70127.1 peptidase M56, BlaR1 [Flavobacterium aquidurense]SHG14525.1 TonB protein C-terminal [Flavobacterium frigidimaris]